MEAATKTNTTINKFDAVSYIAGQRSAVEFLNGMAEGLESESVKYVSLGVSDTLYQNAQLVRQIAKSLADAIDEIQQGVCDTNEYNAATPDVSDS